MAALPISIKGVILDGTRVVLAENERGEWELPGGRIEPGESPTQALTREISEEGQGDGRRLESLGPWPGPRR